MTGFLTLLLFGLQPDVKPDIEEYESLDLAWSYWIALSATIATVFTAVLGVAIRRLTNTRYLGYENI